MPLWVQNVQRCVNINTNWLKFVGDFLLSVAGAARFDASVVCVGTKKIRYLNKTYRGLDEDTDILSFSYHEGLTPGNLPQPARDEDYNLGDLIVSLPVIKKDAEEDGVSLQQRLPVIITHGYCHLMGYTHSAKDEWKQMFLREEHMLKSYNRTFGENLKPLTQALY